MRHIKQRHKTDCGIACVAMIAGVPYATAKKLFKANPDGKWLTETDDLKRALGHFGITTEVRFRRLPATDAKRWKEVLRRTGRVALVRSPVRPSDNTYHWRVYDPVKDRVLDPRQKNINTSAMHASSYLVVHTG